MFCFPWYIKYLFILFFYSFYMVSTRLAFFHKQNHRALVLKHTIINLCLKKQERLHCCLHHSTFFWRPQPLACCIFRLPPNRVYGSAYLGSCKQNLLREKKIKTPTQFLMLCNTIYWKCFIWRLNTIWSLLPEGIRIIGVHIVLEQVSFSSGGQISITALHSITSRLKCWCGMDDSLDCFRNVQNGC